MPKLTKRRVDGLPAREREYFVWDDQLKGFGVKHFTKAQDVMTIAL